MRIAARVGLLWLACILSFNVHAQQLPDDLAVEVKNLSEPVRCAEKDNVYIPFAASGVGGFRIQVAHPAYIGTLAADRQSADWEACDMSGDPSFRTEPRQLTLYESERLRLVGYTYPDLWRPSTVPFRIGRETHENIQLVQLWILGEGRPEEVLVVYPQDGYWRARPMTPPHLNASAYGSSFLVGPVENDGRPIVALKELSFEPETKTFRLIFARGGSGTVKLSSIDRDRAILDVAFEGGLPADKPFAALRSMYVTEGNADAARVAWLTKDGKGWGEAPVMAFGGASAIEFWLGRTLPSRHNTSAPDVELSHFRARGADTAQRNSAGLHSAIAN